MIKRRMVDPGNFTRLNRKHPNSQKKLWRCYL